MYVAVAIAAAPAAALAAAAAVAALAYLKPLKRSTASRKATNYCGQHSEHQCIGFVGGFVWSPSQKRLPKFYFIPIKQR